MSIYLDELRNPICISAALLALAIVSVTARADALDDLPAGYWYEVPGSRLSSVDPCPTRNCSYSANEGQPAVIDDWTGGAFASRYGTQGGMIVWGGGHNGYYGNEVYVFDVGARKWKRASEPVNNPTCNHAEAELQDGSPCAAHTYDYVEYHPATNSFVKLGSASDHDLGGSGSPRVHLFNLDSLKWRRGVRKPGSFVNHTGAASAYDPNRDAFWIVPAYNQPIGMYDPDADSGAGKWTLYNAFNVDIGIVGAIDPTQDLFVMIDGSGTHTVVAFDLKNPNQVKTLTTSGDTGPQSSGGAGFEWDPVNKVFVAWTGGTSVYTLTPPTGNWQTGTWIWKRVPPAAGNAVVPSSPNANSTYSRWRYVPSLNAFVVVNRASDNVYFYRLSSAVPAPKIPADLSVR